jgi:hypothetical protein
VIKSLQRLSTPRAVDVTRVLHLGGVAQVVSIRGEPVLVFVHGGPGTPLMPTAWMWQRPVEEFFTVVHYDQRAPSGSGSSATAVSQPVEPTVTTSCTATSPPRAIQSRTQWMDELAAPFKAVEWFEDSAHMLMYEEPGHFLTALLTHLYPIATAPAATR